MLDASSSEVIAGMITASDAGGWTRLATDANRGIFQAVEGLLHRGQLTLNDVDAFAYCEGPGSSLGVRTVAMTLRTWNALKPTPCYAFQSLALAAAGEWAQRPREFAVIADARRESWHVQRITESGTLRPLARLAASELGNLEVLTPETFRAWSTVPPHAHNLPYDPARWFTRVSDHDLFSLRTEPDALQTTSTDYKKWSGQTHSAETSQR